MKTKEETNPKRIVHVDKGAKNGDMTCMVVVEVKDGKATVISEEFKKPRKGVQNR
jgi:predicted Holliday junction resolvase-like endonuclease